MDNGIEHLVYPDWTPLWRSYTSMHTQFIEVSPKPEYEFMPNRIKKGQKSRFFFLLKVIKMKKLNIKIYPIG